MKDREGFNKYISVLLKKTANTVRKMSDVGLKAYEMFSIPQVRTKAILGSKAGIEKATDEDLLWIVSAIYELYPVQNLLDHYYTDEELHSYLNKSFGKQTISFPLDISAVKIENDQYLGVISIRDIVRLYQDNRLRYSLRNKDNVKTVSNGKETHLIPVVSGRKMSAMVNYIQSNDYISDVITINVNPETSKTEYKDGTLTILKADQLEIVDNFVVFDVLLKTAKADIGYNKNLAVMITLFRDEKQDILIRQRKNFGVTYVSQEARTLADLVVNDENYIFRNEPDAISPKTIQMGIGAFFREWKSDEIVPAILNGISIFERQNLLDHTNVGRVTAYCTLTALYCIALDRPESEMIDTYKTIISSLTTEDITQITYMKTPLNLQNLYTRLTKGDNL